MKLCFWKRPTTEATPERLLAELCACRARGDALLTAAVALLACAKEFAFGLPDVDSAKFTHAVETAKRHLSTADTATELQKRFAGTPEQILDFIEREKACLEERERELINIINLLRQGLTTLYDDNQTFNTHLRDHHLEMERILDLDDIRRIKEQLRNEVDAINATIAEKKSTDLQQLESLSREVDTLRKNLETAIDASTVDALTRAQSRLTFDLTLQRLFDRRSITSERFCLLMCDLDDFKGVNDNHGHQTGDRVLICFVAECKSWFREQDVIARYGGEEFALLLPGASLRQARQRAELFCRHLAAKRFRIMKDRPEPTLAFTVSIGVAEVRKDDSMETLLNRADRALYLAKHQGKNGVMTEQDVARREKQGMGVVGGK